MKLDNEYFSGVNPIVPVNNLKEYIGITPSFAGIEVPKVRAWEESDPVYYLVDDAPLADLRARDDAIASFATTVGAGIFSKDFWSFNNDTDPAFSYEYGIVSKAATTNFLGSRTCRAYNQFSLPSQVRADSDILVKLNYSMADNFASKRAKMTLYYDIAKRGDSLVSIPIAQQGSDSVIFSTPNSINTLENWCEEVDPPEDIRPYHFVIPASALTALGTGLHGALLSFVLERTVDIVDNNAAKLQLFGITFYQNLPS